jgi:hypothetical protein
MYEVFYLDEVLNDIRNTKQWYNEQQEGLGDKFVLSVIDTVSNIIKMPSAYAIQYKNIRVAHTKIYPYNVHFYMDETKMQVVITGIIHNRRKNALFISRNA